MVMTGEAKVYGADGTLAFTGAATTTNEAQSLQLSDEFDIAEARNRTGDVKTRSAHNRRHTISVTILWKDGSGTPTQSTAKSNVKFPTMLATVTLASFGNSLVDGDWNYEGGSHEYTNDGFCTSTLKLSRYGDTPAVLAAVS